MGADRNSVAIVGAGTMGWHIALALAVRGVPIRLTDSVPAALECGLAHLTAEVAALAGSGELPWRRTRELASPPQRPFPARWKAPGS